MSLMYFFFDENDFLFLNVFSDRSLNVQRDEEPLFTESGVGHHCLQISQNV